VGVSATWVHFDLIPVNAGFSDVGFRLAFSAGEITGAAQVSLILGSAPFLTERR
jgi:hypothetical protein